VFDITTTGTPAISSVTDSAFSGCIPSTLPASITLDYTGGTTATLDGTPQAGDGGTFTVCLTAANGVGPRGHPGVHPHGACPGRPAGSRTDSSLAGQPACTTTRLLAGELGWGIFTFGAAQFYGSTGSLHLQRPVVGITPAENRGGYWLVASGGGIFAIGNAGYYGSIPGSGLNPSGSGLFHSLNAPIVGMVPSSDGSGYFMVASDGGVFAFGDARFEGSCPGIGGCSGAAVCVVPDATSNGYWVVTSTGAVSTFGDGINDGARDRGARRSRRPRRHRTARANGS